MSNIRKGRNVASIYSDSEEIAAALEFYSENLKGSDRYYMREAATHIYGLYDDAVAMQRRLHELEPDVWPDVEEGEQ